MAGKAALFEVGLALIFVLFFFSNDLCIFGCAGSSGCVGFSRIAVSRGSSPVVALGLLTAEAPLVAEHRLQSSTATGSAVAAPRL